MMNAIPTSFSVVATASEAVATASEAVAATSSLLSAEMTFPNPSSSMNAQQQILTQWTTPFGMQEMCPQNSHGFNFDVVFQPCSSATSTSFMSLLSDNFVADNNNNNN